MDAIQTLRTAFGGAHHWYQGTVADVTEAQANVVPSGVAHPIGSLMMHIVNSEDSMVTMLDGQPTLWESQGWEEKLGLPRMDTQTAETARAFRCDPAALADYTQAVFARTDAYLGSLSEADLDRQIDLSSWGMGMTPVGDILTTMLLGNTYAHTGEISALKGMQGLRGYPF